MVSQGARVGVVQNRRSCPFSPRAARVSVRRTLRGNAKVIKRTWRSKQAPCSSCPGWFCSCASSWRRTCPRFCCRCSRSLAASTSRPCPRPDQRTLARPGYLWDDITSVIQNQVAPFPSRFQSLPLAASPFPPVGSLLTFGHDDPIPFQASE